MLDLFLKDNGNFINYRVEHTICFAACIALIVFIPYWAKKYWNTSQQQLFITLICIAGASTQLFKVIYRYYAGIFDQTADVPLHLCNIMTLVMPFIMWFKWRILACACRDHSGSFLRLVCVWLYTHREWCYQICSMHQFACCCIIPYQCNARGQLHVPQCKTTGSHFLRFIGSLAWLHPDAGVYPYFVFWNDLDPFSLGKN